MCGIVGYIGKQQAYPILIKGLHRLEYRGYDSAGVALINPAGQLNIYKAKGKVAELESFAEAKDVSGTIGIAHTRWATHGEPNTRNAHPHYSETEELAIIHNGIIENYEVLRQSLVKHGYHFLSDTDTEVLVQLIEYTKRTDNVDLRTAVQLALKQVVGAYAIAVLDKSNPDTIVAARKGETELAVGNVVGSNIFNLLLILGVSSLVNPVAVNLASLCDMVILILVSVLVFIFMLVSKKITRLQGLLMVVLYIADVVFAFFR